MVVGRFTTRLHNDDASSHGGSAVEQDVEALRLAATTRVARASVEKQPLVPAAAASSGGTTRLSMMQAQFELNSALEAPAAGSATAAAGTSSAPAAGSAASHSTHPVWL